MAIIGLNLHFTLCACGCYDSCSDRSTPDFSSGGHLSLSVLTTQAYPNYHQAKNKTKKKQSTPWPVHHRNEQRESGQRTGRAFTYGQFRAKITWIFFDCQGEKIVVLNLCFSLKCPRETPRILTLNLALIGGKCEFL